MHLLLSTDTIFRFPQIESSTFSRYNLPLSTDRIFHILQVGSSTFYRYNYLPSTDTIIHLSIDWAINKTEKKSLYYWNKISFGLPNRNLWCNEPRNSSFWKKKKIKQLSTINNKICFYLLFYIYIYIFYHLNFIIKKTKIKAKKK